MMKEGLFWMRLGMAGVGIASLIAAVGCLVVRHRTHPIMIMVHQLAAVGLGILGFVLLMFAWIGKAAIAP